MATLASLRTEVRRRADMVNSTFVSDAELNSYINNSYAELYDILVSRFEDYYISTSTFTITSGNSSALPAGFYKVRGLDYQQSSNDWLPVKRWNFSERSQLVNANVGLSRGFYERMYRVMGGNILILPEDKAPGQYRLWYIPRYTPLAADGDVLGDVLDFDEYIIIDAAIKCLIKEESDVSVLLAMKQALIARVEAMSSNRDSEPERIADVTRSYDGDFFFPRG